MNIFSKKKKKKKKIYIYINFSSAELDHRPESGGKG